MSTVISQPIDKGEFIADIDEFAEADTILRHNFGYYRDQLTGSHPVGE